MEEDEKYKLDDYLGGTHISAIVGVNKYSNSLGVYNNIVNNHKIKMNPQMRAGLMLEDTILKYFTQDTGKKIIKKQYTFRDKKYKYLGGTIDGMLENENSIIDAKNTGYHAWINLWHKGTQIPKYVQVQMQWYMMLTNTDKAYIALFSNGNHFQILEIERDDEAITILRESAIYFWQTHIVNKIPPKDEAPYEEEIEKTFNNEAIELEDLEEIERLKLDIKACNGRKKELELKIKLSMQSDVKYTVGDYELYKQMRITKTIDIEKLVEPPYKESKTEVLKIKKNLNFTL